MSYAETTPENRRKARTRLTKKKDFDSRLFMFSPLFAARKTMIFLTFSHPAMALDIKTHVFKELESAGGEIRPPESLRTLVCFAFLFRKKKGESPAKEKTTFFF